MPSVHIVTRTTKAGEKRYFVRFRVGGRESRLRHGGTFRTKRDAEFRVQWIGGELAAGRVPDLALDREPVQVETLRGVAERWQASRIDVAEATKGVHRKALAHVLKAFGDRDPHGLDPAEIGAWIGGLSATHSRGTCEKVLGALRMALDFAGIRPNPARDDRVKLPRSERREVNPPTASQVSAIIERAAPRYRVALLVIETTGMRVGEVETLTWGDIDEAGGRWRVARQNEKGRRGRWVNAPPDVFAAVSALVPREDRDAADRVFPHVTQAKLRTDMPAPARPPASPSTRRTTCGTAASRSGTCKGSRSRRSANGSGNATCP